MAMCLYYSSSLSVHPSQQQSSVIPIISLDKTPPRDISICRAHVITLRIMSSYPTATKTVPSDS